MKQFTELYVRLDQTNATSEKLAALTSYLTEAPPEDAAWAIWFLSGRRLRRLVKRASLRRWVLEASGHTEWMLDECYQSVGDLAETIALLLPEPRDDGGDDLPLAVWVRERLLPLGELDEEAQGRHVRQWWQELPGTERFVLNKLLTGAMRVGVSQRLVTRALGATFSVEPAIVAHRLMGDWEPSAAFMEFIANGDADDPQHALPYPFCLASPLLAAPETLGAAREWQAEWKWDGIRLQVIRRGGSTVMWSRGEERMEGRFPEIEQAVAALPDGTVLDGEVLARDREGRPSFAALQRRIGRLKVDANLLADAPVDLVAYDLLEIDGQDLRSTPLVDRRARLEHLLGRLEAGSVALSETLDAADWDELAAMRDTSRERHVEGLMLKRKSSAYGIGRRRGDWWKWKVSPYTIDAVLLYAQPGSGRRSNLLTDYTFAVWRGDELVPVCKAYSGLDNDEIASLDRWIRRHTQERFGPVRAVEPAHVFEIAFEGIQRSKRHKSGVAFRFPRIARWRHDLGIADADTLDSVRELLE